VQPKVAYYPSMGVHPLVVDDGAELSYNLKLVNVHSKTENFPIIK